MSAIPLPPQNADGSYSFVTAMAVDADGSPHAYAPKDSGLEGLDYLANAGHPGNWWALACDAHGNPYTTDQGFYVSTTTYERPGFEKSDPRRYADSEVEKFFVIPAQWRKQAGPVVVGCRGSIEDMVTGQIEECAVLDLGPAGHVGEASIAAALAFGVNPDPKNGGTEEKRFKYTFWPGVAAEGYELQSA